MNNNDLIPQKKSVQPFGKINFILMAICLAMIVLGFILMTGPGSSIERGFEPDIFSARRIIVGPAFAFIGFLAMSFAILYRPGKQLKDSEKEKTSNKE